MCAFCTVFSSGPHWTEAGTNAGRAQEAKSGRSRYLDRLYRVNLINRILGYYGCTAVDWANNQYIIRSLSGQTAIVEHLPQAWMSVEGFTQRPTDPLDPGLLEALRKQDPVVRR